MDEDFEFDDGWDETDGFFPDDDGDSGEDSGPGDWLTDMAMLPDLREC